MTSLPIDDYAVLRAGGTLIAIEAKRGSRPVFVYAGPDLPGTEPNELALLATRQHAPGTAAIPLHCSLMNEVGTGASGPAGLLAHRGGVDWAIDLRIASVEQTSDDALVLHLEDTNTQIIARHELSLCRNTGVFTCSTVIENPSDVALELDWCAALCIPLDPRLETILSFTGRWAGEFRIEEIDAFQGSIVRENTSGRTSHSVFPGVFAASPTTGEHAGLAAGFHLAWSGNSRLRIDRHADGHAIVQSGEMAMPGEISLGKGEIYRTPDLIAAWSHNGLSGVSDKFHIHLRDHILDRRSFAKPRPVHYNTWEAVYFNHDETVLLELAERAASVGAERFVLDDGWFGGRRHDGAGLGDWWVSPDIYPNGLHPIVERVRELGMEFGLWFEPEMVNPDSELYRAHPDWVLSVEGVETVPFRGQYTLDLTRHDAFDHLFDAISALVSEYSIDYIKWDMNRDTHFPGNRGTGSGQSTSSGRAVMHRQTRAVYRLIEALRDEHPALEIESCSSGGGRADFGILRHSDRIWTSDNNDARERQIIQRGASHFFPPRVLGSHVSPKRCHITGRRFSMEFRVATAIFGHMGMELDLRDEKAADLEILKAGITLHKKHRKLIHEGRFSRLASSPNTNLVGCISRDQSEALFSYAILASEPLTLPARIHFEGLDPQKKYRVRLVWPQREISLSTPSILEAADLTGAGTVFSAEALIGHGIQPPLTYPDTCLIYHLEATD